MTVSELIKYLSAYDPSDKVYIGCETEDQSWDELPLRKAEDITDGDVDGDDYFNEDGHGIVVITG